MKCPLKLKSSAAKIILFSVTFAIGVSSTAFFLLESCVARIETSRVREIQTVQAIRAENNSSVKTELSNRKTTPNVVQSELVDFPVNGRVVVESVEEVGEFPQMVFRSQKTGEVLLRSSIEDEDKWLIPANDNELSQPKLRFRTHDSENSESPLIMSVGVYYGGSDDAYYLTVFGETNGKITRLNEKPFFANVQGGYYLGHLNEKFGYGLAVWTFIWGNSGAHYDEHKYRIEIYRLKNGKLSKVLEKASRKKYGSDKGFDALLELGIKATDQRKEIPEVNVNLSSE
ncbi:MAG TPA: hypothetical protein VIL74_01875 [Pyrinomonadaceae bacterium]|jgi:hypothetical protein